jgi:hypothetical protein
MPAVVTACPRIADLGEPMAPTRSTPARGPRLWAMADVERDPAPDSPLQSVPAFLFD